MANVKNLLPEMTEEERDWFDKCPKAVLWAICQQFGMRLADDFTAEAAFAVMQEEWRLLHAHGVVPQKPHNVAKSTAKRQADRAKREAFRKQYPDGWCAREHMR